jgi:hypothetical protein
MKKRTNITTHDEMKDKLFGKIGTTKRTEIEKGYEHFKTSKT